VLEGGRRCPRREGTQDGCLLGGQELHERVGHVLQRPLQQDVPQRGGVRIAKERHETLRAGCRAHSATSERRPPSADGHDPPVDLDVVGRHPSGVESLLERLTTAGATQAIDLVDG
jgi:hypothetical protein